MRTGGLTRAERPAWLAELATRTWRVLLPPKQMTGSLCEVDGTWMPPNGGIQRFCSKLCRRRRHNRRAA